MEMLLWLWTGKLFVRMWADTKQMCYFVTYSRNRIRFEFLMTRLGDYDYVYITYIVYVHIHLNDTLHEKSYSKKA